MVSIRIVPVSSTEIHSLPNFVGGIKLEVLGIVMIKTLSSFKLGKGLSFLGSMSAGRLCSVLESVMSGRMDPLVC